MGAEGGSAPFYQTLSEDAPWLDKQSLGRLCAYYELLVEANRTMNLTGEAAPEDMARRHFLDSLAEPALAALRPGMQAIDVGTGAGFPGLVLAIVRPDVRFTLLDSLQKRVGFLRQVAQALELENIQFLAARAEDAARTKLREHFDVALSRAVAALPVLLEYTLPFVRVGGSALCWKGPSAAQEIADSAAALRTLGGGECEVLSYSPDSLREYAILRVPHIRSCPPQYPRKAGIPTKKPL